MTSVPVPTNWQRVARPRSLKARRSSTRLGWPVVTGRLAQAVSAGYGLPGDRGPGGSPTMALSVESMWAS